MSLNSDEDITMGSDWYQTNHQVGVSQAGQVNIGHLNIIDNNPSSLSNSMGSCRQY